MNQLFNTNLTNSQCQKRWTQYITPDIAERKVGPWSADEVKYVEVYSFFVFIIYNEIEY